MAKILQLVAQNELMLFSVHLNADKPRESLSDPFV